MQVSEKSAAGLSRTFEVVIARDELARKLDARIEEIQPQVRLKGFRPGKVPSSHIRKMFGRSMMDEIIEDTVRETSQKALDERELRPAAFPEIHMESDAEAVAKGEADLAFHMHVEVMPEFKPLDVHALSLARPVAEVDDAAVTTALENLAADQKIYEDRDAGAKAEDGDLLVMDFVGRINGEAFDGGAGEDVEIVLGSGRFIPGFEEALVGATAGKSTIVEITFPEDYPAENLRGKPAAFDVDVKAVRAPRQAEVDDALAKQVGLESLDALKDAVRRNLETDFARQSRSRLKRRLLDKLDEAHDFDLPERMVDTEFETIWRAVKADLDKGEIAPEDEGKSEDELQAEYKKIAERRVRLGLVLAEIGKAAGVEVAEEELARAINMEARRYPGREREVASYLSQNAQARAQLRAPIYEEKVVDYILELAEISDESMSQEDLFTDEAI